MVMSQTLQKNITSLQTLAYEMQNLADTVQQRVRNLEGDKLTLRIALADIVDKFDDALFPFTDDGDNKSEADILDDLTALHYSVDRARDALERTRE